MNTIINPIKTSIINVLMRYNKLLIDYPIRVSSVTAGVLGATGDMIN